MSNSNPATYDAKSAEGRSQGRIRLDPNKLEAQGALRVGFFTSFTGTVKSRGTVIIGRFCAIGDDCRLIAGSHNPQMPNIQIRLQNAVGGDSGHLSKGPIRIGHNVWIGDGVKILSGVTIGDGAIIGAGSVVTSDVPAFAIFGGMPARMLRWRFTENVRLQMTKIAWWNWSWDRITRNTEFFNISIAPDEEIDLANLVQD